MDVVSKIKKLLQLADTKRNSNIEEAAAAAAKAQKLMEKHRIHRAMLEDEVTTTVSKLLEDHGKPENWKLYLASTLAKYNGCYIVQSDKYFSDNKIFVVGSESDIATIQYLYGYIVLELNRLCLAELTLFKVNFGIAISSNFTSSFYLGAITIIGQRLEEATNQIRLAELKRASQPEKRAAINSALHKIDTRITKAKEWIKNNLTAEIKDVVIDNSNLDGYLAGKKAAENISITSNKKLK